jgi:hypothetical protein
MRLHHQGHPIVPQNLTAQNFLISLLRRQQNMLKFHSQTTEIIDFEKLKPAIMSANIENPNLHWFDWQRYSSRQKSTIALGGIMGQFTLTGDLPRLLPYLELGMLYHVGKSAVLGMGKYEITNI